MGGPYITLNHEQLTPVHSPMIECVLNDGLPMVSIARKNLFHDKIRFAVALAGISFAVVLITVQLGVYLAFRSNVSVLIDHTEADIWITSHGLENFDFGRPFSEKKVYEVEEVPGVEWADKYLLAFGYWKRRAAARKPCRWWASIRRPWWARRGTS